MDPCECGFSNLICSFLFLIGRALAAQRDRVEGVEI
jgi:hypothetical protein